MMTMILLMVMVMMMLSLTKRAQAILLNVFSRLLLAFPGLPYLVMRSQMVIMLMIMMTMMTMMMTVVVKILCVVDVE